MVLIPSGESKMENERGLLHRKGPSNRCYYIDSRMCFARWDPRIFLLLIFFSENFDSFEFLLWVAGTPWGGINKAINFGKINYTGTIDLSYLFADSHQIAKKFLAGKNKRINQFWENIKYIRYLNEPNLENVAKIVHNFL